MHNCASTDDNNKNNATKEFAFRCFQHDGCLITEPYVKTTTPHRQDHLHCIILLFVSGTMPHDSSQHSPKRRRISSLGNTKLQQQTARLGRIHWTDNVASPRQPKINTTINIQQSTTHNNPQQRQQQQQLFGRNIAFWTETDASYKDTTR